MSYRARWLSILLTAAALAACSAPATEEQVASLSQAVNACNETVPADRSVDGLPAYAQCSGVSSGNIYSNDGIDTSTTSLGADWIQTQRGGGYQCTEWAYRYMHFRWNVNYRSGNASEWCDGNLPNNLVLSTIPVHGDLIVFDGGVCGAAASTGHVAVVDLVNADATVTIVEENDAGRRKTKQSCALCYLHATANDGSAGGTLNASGGMAARAGSGGALGSGAGGRAQNGGAPSGGTAGGGAPSGGALNGGAPNGGSTRATFGGSAQATFGGAGGTVAGAPGESGRASTPSGGSVGVAGSVAGAPASSGAPTNAGDRADSRANEAVQGSCACSLPGARTAPRGAGPLASLCAMVGLLSLRRRSPRRNGYCKGSLSARS